MKYLLTHLRSTWTNCHLRPSCGSGHASSIVAVDKSGPAFGLRPPGALPALEGMQCRRLFLFLVHVFFCLPDYINLYLQKGTLGKKETRENILCAFKSGFKYIRKLLELGSGWPFAEAEKSSVQLLKSFFFFCEHRVMSQMIKLPFASWKDKFQQLLFVLRALISFFFFFQLPEEKPE